MYLWFFSDQRLTFSLSFPSIQVDLNSRQELYAGAHIKCSFQPYCAKQMPSHQEIIFILMAPYGYAWPTL